MMITKISLLSMAILATIATGQNQPLNISNYPTIILYDDFETPKKQGTGFIKITPLNNPANVGANIGTVTLSAPNNLSCGYRVATINGESVKQMIILRYPEKYLNRGAIQADGWAINPCDFTADYGGLFQQENPYFQMIETGNNTWEIQVTRELPSSTRTAKIEAFLAYKKQRVQGVDYSMVDSSEPIVIPIVPGNNPGNNLGTGLVPGARLSNKGSQFNGGAHTFDESYRSHNTVQSIAFIDLSDLSLHWLERKAYYLVRNNIFLMIIDGTETDAQMLRAIIGDIQVGPAPQSEKNLRMLMNQYGVRDYPSILQGGWVRQ